MTIQTPHTQRSISHIARGVLMLLAGAALVGAGTVQAESEGIQVHGDWVLTIHDPDGSLVLEMPFKNALTDTGKNILEDIFAGVLVFSYRGPTLFAVGAATTGVATQETTAQDRSCGGILQDLYSETGLVPNAGATFSRSFALPPECVSGSSWTLTGVYTFIYYENESGGAFGNFFTSKTLDAPVTVLPDQLVTLKVTFSFE